ncbi:MAG: hypothetical protein LBF66_02495 [Holosporales bacterium]|nr:hypothetical protein [Holosporales bacterium]
MQLATERKRDIQEFIQRPWKPLRAIKQADLKDVRRETILSNIHIPPDAQGLLRGQGIETSAFVPRSVSREPLYVPNVMEIS